MIDLIIDIAPIVVGIASSIFIAYYFKVRVKPRIEIIFEKNEQNKLEILFWAINMFDSTFESFYQYAEKKISSIPKTDGEFVNIHLPVKIILEENQPVHVVEPATDHPEIVKMFNTFNNHNEILKQLLDRAKKDQQEIDDSFKDDSNMDLILKRFISFYMARTIDFMFGITANYSHVYFLKSRLKHANLIIDILKKDKLIPETGSINEFVTKWERYVESENRSSKRCP